MTEPAISVAMSVYNNEPYLPAAIESVLAQDFGDFEFLILNDGSKDGSREVIDGYAAKDSRIRPIHRENKGLIASLNEIIDNARAPLIARMDGDDMSKPNRFSHQLAFLEANPDHGVVGTWMDVIDEHGEPWPERQAEYPITHDGFMAAIGKGRLISHPSVIMRRDLVRKVGGYRAMYRHCEDIDLWLRLSEITRICSIAEPLYVYRRYDMQVSYHHSSTQRLGAAIALLAHEARLEGRPDPTGTLDKMPSLDQLDMLFGKKGLDRALRAHVAPGLLHDEDALVGADYAMLLDFVREGGQCEGLWRTVPRLLRVGRPGRALMLAAALARRSVSG